MKAPAPRWRVALAGAAAGLALGLAYAWLIDPVRATNTYPALLRSDYRRDWVRLAALSHLADGDPGRLRSRLDGFDGEDVEAGLGTVIQEFAGAAGQDGAARRAATMAEAVGVTIPETPEPSPTATPSPIATPTPTPTPEAARTIPSAATATLARASTPGSPTPSPTSATPSATLEPPSAITFRVAQRNHVCRPQGAPRIEIIVRDALRNELPGVRVWLLWEDGADRAVTGLMPERGAGYVDFDVEMGVRYSMGLGDIGMPLISDLRVLACADGEEGEARLGSWTIVIEQRPDEGPGT